MTTTHDGTRTRRKRYGGRSVVCRAPVLAALLAALVTVGAPAQRAAAVTPFTIKTDPALDPPFSPAIHHYVVRCTGHPTTEISISGTGTVTIGGRTFGGPASAGVGLVANQAVYVSSGGQTYGVRCLPANFPAYTSVVSGTPQVHGYLVTLTRESHMITAPYYVTAFDNRGVPIWWYPVTSTAADAKFIGTDEIAWWLGQPGAALGDGTFTIRNLAGQVVASVGDPAAGVPLDLHDFQALPNGDYLGIQYVPTTLNLSSWGLSPTAKVLDGVIVEVNPSDQVVWRWSTIAHVNVAKQDTNWRDPNSWHDSVPDVVHMNSVQEVGNQIIMSSRLLDAVYDIDRTTGKIIWKLGGSPGTHSLRVVGNTYPQVFSGQHDARELPDGTITVHDNATQEAGHPARALRFRIDIATRTATIIEDVTDASFPKPSPRAGSVAKLAGGDWVVDWGTSDYVAELTPTGTHVITITYPGCSSYRAAVVPVSDDALDQGMDARFTQLRL